MPEFDPDAYLSQKTTAAPAFDPDKYLAERSPQPQRQGTTLGQKIAIGAATGVRIAGGLATVPTELAEAIPGPGTAVKAGIGAAIGATSDVIAQGIERAAGVRQKFSPAETGVAAGLMAIPLGEFANIGRAARTGIRALQGAGLGAAGTQATTVLETGKPASLSDTIWGAGIGGAFAAGGQVAADKLPQLNITRAIFGREAAPETAAERPAEVESVAKEEVTKNATQPYSETGAIPTERGISPEQQAKIDVEKGDTRQAPAEKSARQEITPRIVSTAVQREGKIFQGQNPTDMHVDIGTQHGLGEPTEAERGFIVQDPSGKTRFVGREEGGKVADQTGQRPAKFEGQPLTSEHLQGREPEVQPPEGGVPSEEVQKVEGQEGRQGRVLAESEPSVQPTGAPPPEAAIPPEKPVTPADTPVGGVNAAAMAERPIDAPPPGTGVGWEETRAYGNKWLDSGGDINKVMADFNRTGKLSEWEVGKGAAYLERLQADTNRAADALRENPNDPALQEIHQQALSREQRFSNDFKPMATAASNQLKGFQGRVPLNDEMADSFTALARKYGEVNGKEMTPEQVVKADRIAKQNAKSKSDYRTATEDLYRKADTEYGRIKTTRKGPPTFEDIGRTFGAALKEVCDT